MNCNKNNTQPPVDKASLPAAQPIRQGKAPGTAPTKTEIELTFFSGVYINAYKNKLNNAMPADNQLKRFPNMNTPITPVIIAKAHPSAAVILPDATGRLAVRFIIASVSFSTTWLI